MTYPDGRKYVGAFKGDQRHGQGTMLLSRWPQIRGRLLIRQENRQRYHDLSRGRKYTGEFKDGQITGQGAMTYSDGKKMEGTFKNGELVGN
ncbi:hypothetical protein D1BOALGB6SA_7364 [Olavius sp. associated proteobacterium Delta 1]|nr:hypothetical protein D1BOALGB6SA_7364 [Olavius sp. associated proteobacterium Delta 1]